MVDQVMSAFPVANISTVVLTAAELLVAAVLSWIGLNLYRVSRNPKTTPGDGVILDLGLVIVTAAVLRLSVSSKLLF